MTRSLPALLFLVVVLVIAAGCSSAPSAVTPAASVPQKGVPHYVIGVDAAFPPFTSLDRQGNFTGFDIEAARAVADREGFEVTFVAVPWDMAISSLETGNVDMIWSGMTISPGRSALVNFSVPYYHVNQSIAVRRGSGFTLQDFLSGRLRTGVQAGTTETEWATVNLVDAGLMARENLTEYPDVATLSGALMNGTVDAALVQEPALAEAIKGKPLVIIGRTGAKDAYAVAARKEDTALLATVDHGLLGLMQDPAWKALKIKYGL